MPPARALALDLDGIDVHPLTTEVPGEASLESLLGGHAMTEAAGSSAPCSCCIACCCCCCPIN
ncbi:hypothetical protein AB0K60_13965 [Thermopolyspora sp. NPDC052614]|uniref:hypothetical protein n=1 Tax=Thermopolyspora sp. NPDC052614 TaxID=3155682 RepID=UPI0034498C1B